jgi:hypothetical protein
MKKKLMIDSRKGTTISHLKYIGEKSHMNKSSLCIHFSGNQYDPLVRFRNNPQK